MKRLLLAVLIVFSTIGVFAQGQVIFANSSHSIITNHFTGLPAPGGPEQDDTQVGLYVGNVGDAVWSLQLIGSTTNCFYPGRYSGGIRTLVGWVGTVQLQVRVWLSTVVYPSYEAALAGALGGDSSVQLGSSLPQNVLLTQPPTPPAFLANADAGMSPVVIPEPSSTILGLFGLGAWFMLHRKK